VEGNGHRQRRLSPRTAKPKPPAHACLRLTRAPHRRRAVRFAASTRRPIAVTRPQNREPLCLTGVNSIAAQMATLGFSDVNRPTAMLLSSVNPMPRLVVDCRTLSWRVPAQRQWTGALGIAPPNRNTGGDAVVCLKARAERLSSCSLRSPRPRTGRRPADHLGSTKMTEKICPECNGEGVVDQGTEDERRCPTCNGSGVVPDDGQDPTRYGIRIPSGRCRRAGSAKPASVPPPRPPLHLCRRRAVFRLRCASRWPNALLSRHPRSTPRYDGIVLRSRVGQHHRLATTASLRHSILYSNNSEPKSMHHLFVERSFAPQNLTDLGPLNAGIACPCRLASGQRHLGPEQPEELPCFKEAGVISRR